MFSWLDMICDRIRKRILYQFLCLVGNGMDKFSHQLSYPMLYLYLVCKMSKVYIIFNVPYLLKIKKL